MNIDWSSCSSNGIPTLDCAIKVVEVLIYYAFYFAGIVGVMLMIIGGIRFILSGGDAKQVDQSQKLITYALIGLVLLFLSSFIINFIAQVTGAECILNFGFSTCK
ncbi:MAG: hypothetical protein NTZ20_03805 [Candidatus Levybacteria bacterium]|nr:hypothetical protein [Candidatus Levybacteria bacterium]